MFPERVEDPSPLVVGEHAGERGALAKLDRKRRLRRERLEDRLGPPIEDRPPGNEPTSTHASRMRLQEALKVRAGTPERALRVGDQVTRYRSVEPERLALVTVQSRAGPHPAREGLDLAPAKASLCRASLVRQPPLIAEVDDMLP